MLQVIMFILSVTLATVNGWGACYSGEWWVSKSNTISCQHGRDCAAWGSTAMCSDLYGDCNTSLCGTYQQGDFFYTNPKANSADGLCANTNGSCYWITLTQQCIYQSRCNTQRDADSLNCILSDKQWVGGECKECLQGDTSYTEISCAYDAARGQYLNLANKVTIVNCEATVQENQYYSNNCDSSCTDNSDLTCLGSVDGVNVYLRSCNGKVTKCEADGSCDAAIRKVASGECENPNSPPNGNNSSSSSEQGSSSSGGNVADSLGWLKDSLRVLHLTDSAGFAEVNNNLENIQPFVAGTYDQVTDIAGTVHDINSNLLTGFEFLNDIKENTGNTANNTNGINNKLTTTNTLLEQINNKNWHPTINVSSPSVTVQGDTNIINVQGDTAKAPFEILQFLKGLFGGSDTTGNYDTTGWGGITDSAKSELDSTLLKADFLRGINCDTTGGRKCDDKIIGAHGIDSAAGRLRTAYRGVVDSLRNGAFGDSLNEWGSKFTGNGVIVGSGSANCPSVLTRNYRVDIYQGAGYNFTLGTYLCAPIFGNVTAWALCRILLRAGVALACMWFLFKCATGFKGNSGDDE